MNAPPFISMQTFLTTKEAAITLRVSTKTLGRWRANKQGPEYIKINRTIVYPAQSIDEWAERHKRT